LTLFGSVTKLVDAVGENVCFVGIAGGNSTNLEHYQKMKIVETLIFKHLHFQTASQNTEYT